MTQPWEIEGFLEVRDNTLHIDGVNAVELAREHGTPLFVFSESRIRRNIERLRKSASVIDCPLKLCYAAKAMSTMGILRAIKDANCDIEVNSGGELWKALKAGFTGKQVIFNGTSKEIWEIELAIENSIYAIQVDSLYELSLIEETAKRLGKKANVSLRLVPEIETGTHSGLQTALLTSKFGMMPNEAFEAFQTYKGSPDLDLCGIHLHIGSQNPDPDAYSQALQVLIGTMLRIHEGTKVKLKHVNLGGGFPVNYSRGKQKLPEHIQEKIDEMVSKGVIQTEWQGRIMTNPVPKEWIENYAREKMFEADFEPHVAIGHAWKAVKSRANQQGLKEVLDGLTILLEPGRSIIADAGICLTTVRNMKQRPLSEINRSMNEANEAAKLKIEEDVKKQESVGSGINFGIYDIERSFVDPTITGEHWVLTDAGFNILLSMETYKWYYHVVSAERAGEGHEKPYKLAGPLCDGGDVYFDHEGHGRLPEYRLLPENVQPGEVLALLNAGAYTLAQESQYNGRFLPAVALVRASGEAELIRRRECFEDLISADK